MEMDRKSTDIFMGWLETGSSRLFIIVIFSISFAYIEAAVVVYLRTIFYPEGFSFPMPEFGVSALWQKLLLVEVGREAATLVLILNSAWLLGKNLRQRVGLFMIIFAVWDIFYYVWLKVLLNWPNSIMDWDILFLMPMVWASPVLAPVLLSIGMLVFAVLILRRTRPIKVAAAAKFGFVTAVTILITSFCIGGLYIAEPDFRSHFYWPVFTAGYILAIATFFKCLVNS